MKIPDSEECQYCVNLPDSTLHTLINCPISAKSWKRVKLWLRANVNR